MALIAVSAGRRDDSALCCEHPLMGVVAGADAGRLADGRSVVIVVRLQPLVEGILGVHSQAGEGGALLPGVAVLAILTVCDGRQGDAVDGRVGLRRCGGSRLVGLVHRNREAAGCRLMVRCGSLEIDRSGVRNGGETRHIAILTILRQAIGEGDGLVVGHRGGSGDLRGLGAAGVGHRAGLRHADVGHRRFRNRILHAGGSRANRDAGGVGAGVGGGGSQRRPALPVDDGRGIDAVNAAGNGGIGALAGFAVGGQCRRVDGQRSGQGRAVAAVGVAAGGGDGGAGSLEAPLVVVIGGGKRSGFAGGGGVVVPGRL